MLAGCIGGSDEVLDPASEPGASSIFSDTAVFEGRYDTTGPYSRPLIEGSYGILEPEVVGLESEVDGATIQMGIVRPDVPEGTRVPVIAIASQYFAPMTPAGIEENPKNAEFWDFNHHEYYVQSFTPHGYAIAFIATRGSGGSGGCWDVVGPREAADIDQAVTWLSSQAWSNGNVGLSGISSEGATPWLAAAGGNPAVKTIVPVAGFPDLYTFAYANGTAIAGQWPPLVFGLSFIWGDPSRAAEPSADASSAQCDAVADGALADAHANATAGRADPVGFWNHRDWRDDVLEQYEGSVFLVHGFNDENVRLGSVHPWINDLVDGGSPVKQLIGQWGHAYPDHKIFGVDHPVWGEAFGPEADSYLRWDYAEILLRWFDRWLKDDTEVDIGPSAQVQDTSGQWRSEEMWPPIDTSPLALHLASEGSLSEDPDAPAGASSIAACPDCPRFETGPLDAELRFSGLPTLHLTVTPSGPGGQIAADLYLDGPDGEVLLGYAAMDLRVADGTEEPNPVTPGEPIVARMQFTPMDVHVPDGAGLVLVVRPHAVAGPLTMPPTPVELTTGGDASVLTLHTFHRGPDDARFFTPPGVTPAP